MDDQPGERIDPLRTALLGISTIVLATLFLLLLIGDQVSAVTF